MHIPDGFLDLSIAIGFLLISGILEIFIIRKANAELTDKMLPQVALATAGIFVAQMLNFPIIAGTSGHLVGGTLLAVLFGPWIAVFSMTIVVIIQAIVFADGGIIVIGANLFNLAILPPIIGYFTWQRIKQLIQTNTGNLLGISIGAWISIVIAATVCGFQLGISTIFPFDVFLTIPAMVLWHSLIGIGEAVITVTAVIAIAQKGTQLHIRFTNSRYSEGS